MTSLDEKKALLAEAVRQRQAQPEDYPSSFAQERFWIVEQMIPGTALYHVTGCLDIEGSLDLAVLDRAWREIVRRHDALRTGFVQVDGKPVQRVWPEVTWETPLIDISDIPADALLERAGTIAAEFVNRPFDLTQAPLIKVLVIRLGPEHHRIVFCLHHLISDGWSVTIIINELSALYSAFIAGQPSPLPDLPIQYGDYAVWQRQRYAGVTFEEELKYWVDHLKGAPPLLELPTDRPRPPVQSFAGDGIGHDFPPELISRLREFARAERVTLFMVLLAGLYAVLSKYSGQDDIVVGTPIANRSREEIEGLVGLFINTLALRVSTGGDPTFRELLARVKETTLEAYARQDTPFERIVEELAPERNLSYTPVFQIAFSLEDATRRSLDAADLKVRAIPTPARNSKFDLTFFASDEGSTVGVLVEYRTDLWNESTILRLLRHYEAFLETASAHPERRLSELSLLEAAERERIVSEWGGRLSRPSELTIPDLFLEAARRNPGAPAIISEDKTLTYAELENMALEIAARLEGLGVGPDSLVAVCLERSPELIVALLGIVLAGGAYLPLDLDYPDERLRFMLADAKVSTIVTDRALAKRLPWVGDAAQIVLLDEVLAIAAASPAARGDAGGAASGAPSAAEPPAGRRASRLSPDNLAYVDYTSGSTGRPKGVAVPHRAVVRLVKGADFAHLGPDEVFLQFAPVSFDASTLEIWGALCNCAPLVVMPPGAVSLDLLAETLEKHKVTTIFLTSSLFNLMVEAKLESLRGLRQLIFGGEQVSLPHARKAVRELGSTRVINGYGPTENTTFTACFDLTTSAKAEDPELTGEPAALSYPIIGRPISGTTAYVLDRHGSLVPVGVPGELYTGGYGLARGYLGRPDATAEKFVPDPFSSEPGARLYRTGDLVRYREDGTLEFLGRTDSQVKISGFRIELGEVEEALSRHPGVEKVAAIVREDTPGQKHLVAYIVPAAKPGPSAGELRSYLAKRLPEWMIPSAFVLLEDFPLSPNGKLDRRRLPQPDKASTGSTEAYRAPRDDLEAGLAAMWEEILEVKPIGVSDNFFELGGSSLLAARLAAKIEAEMGVRVPLLAMFAEPTVEHLADLVREGRAENDYLYSPLVRLKASGSKPPLFLVHAAGGLVYYYADLIRQLGPDQPAWGLQSRGLYDDSPPFTSVEEMVQAYLPAVRSVAPKGPYCLVGYCMGGVVAYELARALRAAGEEVGFLALVDTSAPRYVSGLRDAPGWALYGTELVNRGLEPPSLLDELEALPDADRLARLLDLGREGRALPPGVADLGRFKRWLAIYEANARAYALYEPEPYVGRAAVLVAADRPGDSMAPTDLGWAEHLSPGFRLKIVPGNHMTMVEPPHVAALAAELGALMTTMEGAGSGVSAERQPPAKEELARAAERELSFGERRLWFLDRFEPGSSAYNLPFPTRLEGPLDKLILVRALEEMTRRHASLRTTFPTVDERPTRKVAPPGPVVLEELTLPEPSDEATVRRALEAEARKPFDLARGPLVRHTLLVVGPGQYVYMPTFHHIIADGWSLAVFCRELGAIYAAFAKGESSLLPEPTLDYAAYAARQRSYLDGEVLERQLAYWRERLSGSPALELPLDRPRRDAEGPAGETVWFDVPEALAREFTLFGRQQGASLFMVLLASFKMLLSVYTGQTDVTVGTPVAGRNQPDIEGIIGFFVNSLVLRTDLGDDPTFREAVARVRDTTLGAFEHQDVPFELLVEHLAPARDLTKSPLFQVMFTLRNVEEPRLELPGVKSEAFNLTTGAARHDLLVSLRDTGHGLGGTVEYNADLFERETIEGLVSHWLGLMTAAVENPDQVLSKLAILGDDERRRIEGGQEPSAGAPAGGKAAGQPAGQAGEGRKLVLGRHKELLPTGAIGDLYVERLDPVGGRRLEPTGDRARLLPSGEIRVLPRPAETAPAVPDKPATGQAKVHVPPRTPLEQALAGLWCDILNVPRVGVNDDFFALGGHSLLATRVVAGIRRLFRVEIPVRELFAAPTVAGLAVAVEAAGGGAGLPPAPAAEDRVTRAPKGAGAAQAAGAAAAPAAPGAASEPRPGSAAAQAPVGSAPPAPLAGQVPPPAPITGQTGPPAPAAAAPPAPLAGQVPPPAPITGQTGPPAPAAAAPPAPLAGQVPPPAPLAGQTAGSAAPAGSGDPSVEIRPVPRTGAVRPSYAQERLWFLDRFEPGSAAYNIAIGIVLRGDLNARALVDALTEVVRRHEALRTTFPEDDGRPVLRIAPPGRVTLETRDIAPKSLEEEAARPFDLAEGPLIRTTLFRVTPVEHILLVVLHHIVADGWSLGVLVRELGTLYTANVKGEPSPLADLPVQYLDYAVRQREWLEGGVLAEQLDYWRGALAGLETLELPTDFPRPERQAFVGSTYRFAIPADLVEAIELACRREGLSLFMFLLGAFVVMLNLLSGQDDIAVGTPMANRRWAETEGLIGLFTNTVVVRTKLAGTRTFREILEVVREAALGAYDHQAVPFEAVVDALNPARDLSRSPLFQVLFSLQNNPRPDFTFAGLETEVREVPMHISKFDLTLAMVETRDGLFCALEHRTDLFTETSVARMASRYEAILRAAVADLDFRPSERDWLLGNEAQKLEEWNRTAVAYPEAEWLVHELVEQKAAEAPGALAVMDGATTLTYAELDRAADLLADRLRQAGAGPDAVVGVLMERSWELVVSLLGVLKSGSAYLPIHPDYPAERVAFMVENAGARLFVTTEELAGRLPGGEAPAGRTVLLFDRAAVAGVLRTVRDDAPPSAGPPPGPLPVARRPARAPAASPDNLAYIIYTSGSTGRPKGVMVTHRAVTNLLLWARETYPLSAADRVFQRTAFTFDVSVLEFFWTLASGACVFVCERGTDRDLAHQARTVREQGVTVVQLVPSMLDAFLDELIDAGSGLAGQTLAEAPAGAGSVEAPSRAGSVEAPLGPAAAEAAAASEARSARAATGNLRLVLSCGEALSYDLWRRFREACDVLLVNCYGPTEATVQDSHWTGGASLPLGPVAPIGRPIANTEFRILSRRLDPVPTGAPGEVCIGGVALARGYVGRPDLTAERFIPDAYSSCPGARLYRTGDLGRYLGDGNVEYLGRMDEQVKIRGFRIEPGETTAVLLRHPGIREAAVVAREDVRGDRRLVAYYVSAGQEALEPGELRSFLASELPEYMLPSAFVRLDALPRTSSGKVDKKALPAPDRSTLELADGYIPPRTPMEATLATLWCELLGVSRVGVKDNFFELGGHSLLAAQLVSRIQKLTGKAVSLSTVFSIPTVEHLAALIGGKVDAGGYNPLVGLKTSGTRPPLFMFQAIGGLVYYYVELARCLDPDQPAWGLQGRGIYDDEPAFRGIEEMGETYARVVRSVQPRGPYAFIGYCMGGVVALETARRLKAEGEEIDPLIMIDTAVPSYMAPLNGQPGWVLYASELTNRGFEKPGIIAKLRERPEEERLEYLLRRGRESRVLPPGVDDMDAFVKWLKVYEINATAYASYKPEPYTGRFTVLPAAERMAQPDAHADIGWAAFARAGLDLTVVPGGHLSVMDRPNVETVAAEIEMRLAVRRGRRQERTQTDT